VDYRYDPEGKRIERRTTTEVTRYGWDGAHLRRETNVANNLLDSHDWAAGQILQSRHLTTSLLVSVRDIGAEPLEGGLPSGDGGYRWRCWLLRRSRSSC
jgi:hypothetical protein